MRHRISVRDPESTDSGASVDPQPSIIDMSISIDKMKETFNVSRVAIYIACSCTVLWCCRMRLRQSMTGGPSTMHL